MEERGFKIDQATAERIWEILATRLDADPGYRQVMLEKLTSGETPLPFVSLVSGTRRVELLQGEPPRLELSADSLEEIERWRAQAWAALEIVALYGVTTRDRNGHSFPLHGNPNNPRGHCLQCGLSYSHWYELASERKQECPNQPPAQALAGHSFPLEDVIFWRMGKCAHCELEYTDWLQQDCPVCELQPVSRNPRSRPSSLAGRSA
jgi:hypothetical protein